MATFVMLAPHPNHLRRLGAHSLLARLAAKAQEVRGLDRALCLTTPPLEQLCAQTLRRVLPCPVHPVLAERDGRQRDALALLPKVLRVLNATLRGPAGTLLLALPNVPLLAPAALEFCLAAVDRGKAPARAAVPGVPEEVLVRPEYAAASSGFSGLRPVRSVYALAQGATGEYDGLAPAGVPVTRVEALDAAESSERRLIEALVAQGEG